MADTITIPSPSVFLTEGPTDTHTAPPSPPKPATANKPKQQRKRNPSGTAAAKPKTAGDKPGEAAAANGVDKKKQTKSRYGGS